MEAQEVVVKVRQAVHVYKSRAAAVDGVGPVPLWCSEKPCRTCLRTVSRDELEARVLLHYSQPALVEDGPWG